MPKQTRPRDAARKRGTTIDRSARAVAAWEATVVQEMRRISRAADGSQHKAARPRSASPGLTGEVASPEGTLS